MSDNDARRWLTHEKPYVDLRDFIERADRDGEIVHAKGVHWDLEMGALVEAVSHKRSGARALLMDEIPGYPKGFRVFSGSANSLRRLALVLGFPEPSSALGLVRAYRDRMKVHRPIPPRTVKSGPIFENVLRDDEIDLYRFPVPRIHEADGGRYIGTEDLVIMRDPEQGWVNCATYRIMVQGKDHTGLWTSPGKQGRLIMEKYFQQGKPCPVVVTFGQDPLLFLASNQNVPYGLSEYDYAGGHRGTPIDVVASELHGLPMPAHAEIAIEGEIHQGDTLAEGPFGEFTGYYASPQSRANVIRVKRLYHRNNPILTLAVPMWPPANYMYAKCIVGAGMLWDDLERGGLIGVQGVWVHEEGASRMFNVISLKQAYAGHARQAGVAAATCQTAAYMGRFTVVVDEDIDPTDLSAVIWAISTRCDPVHGIDFIRNMWSSPLDPVIPLGAKAMQSNRAVIDACRPYERLKEFPKVARASPEILARVTEKFSDVVAKA